MKFLRKKIAIPALALVLLIAGSVLAYDLLGSKNSVLPGEYNAAEDSASGREDMAAPLLNQFQLEGRHYILLSDDQRQEFGLPAEIGEGEIGSRIAAITTAPDPGLIGCEVYSCIPAGGEAVLAVKKNDAYQLFHFFTFESYNNNQDEDSAAYLKLYGIDNAEDIGKVQIIGYSEQSKLEGRTDIRGEITDPAEIAQFYGYYSVLKNAADKYFEALFGYAPTDIGVSSVETDIAIPDAAVPPDAPDAPDAPDTIDKQQADAVSKDEPASKDQPGSSDQEQGVIMDMGGTVSGSGSSGSSDGSTSSGNGSSGSIQPSQGSAGDALSNMVTIRIYNQNGIYYDSPYYRNIRFLSRYEVSEQFAAFLESYID